MIGEFFSVFYTISFTSRTDNLHSVYKSKCTTMFKIFAHFSMQRWDPSDDSLASTLSLHTSFSPLTFLTNAPSLFAPSTEAGGTDRTAPSSAGIRPQLTLNTGEESARRPPLPPHCNQLLRSQGTHPSYLSSSFQFPSSKRKSLPCNPVLRNKTPPNVDNIGKVTLLGRVRLRILV